MIYIFRPTVSEGARALEDALNDQGVPARFSQGRLIRERFRPDRDRLICWGAPAQIAPPGLVALNNVAPLGKFTEAQRLKAAGVATVEVSRQRPQPRPAERPPFSLAPYGNTVNQAGAGALVAALQAHLAAPLPPIEEWLPRANDHVGGTDLLRGGGGDYYSRKENITEEYRLHIFLGKSIRAGKKVHREGINFIPHPWIRSHEGGWFINYDGFDSTRPMRELAAKAVEALGLDFGAVDLGRKADGSLLVLEVNRAPGMEGNTPVKWAEKIAAWASGQLLREAA